MSKEGATLGAAIAARIDAAGSISLHDYMDAANAHYYATRDPLGARGDFTTAPEISQMFGEMVGLWLADLWARTGSPGNVGYVELGPGRGTLATDALRALDSAGCRAAVHFVETSPVLRDAQARAVPDAMWHDSVASLPDAGPLLIVANEFFDALPVRQYLRTDAGWRERMLVNDRIEHGDRFVPFLCAEDSSVHIPPALANAPEGSVVETCPAGRAIMHSLAARIAQQGGVMLAIDYGYAGPMTGDSVQAVQAHRFADPFSEPGARDLTAHVDFTVLAEAATDAGLIATPLAEQGAFLIRIGMSARAEALVARNPGSAHDVKVAFDRLTAPEAMGRLFKVMAFRHPDWPQPEGFA